MSFVRLAARRGQVSPLIIFKATFDYNEVRMSEEDFATLAQECIINDVYPVIVEDFAMMVLFGQVKFVGKGKEDEGEDEPQTDSEQ